MLTIKLLNSDFGRPLQIVAMRHISSEPVEDPDRTETLPASALSQESAAPLSDSWDSEAPTAVHSRRPLFAGPQRLPTT